jgi:hypothetical protein
MQTVVFAAAAIATSNFGTEAAMEAPITLTLNPTLNPTPRIKP